MKDYRATIKITRVHEIGFDSPNSKQALLDAKTIIEDEDFNDGSQIDEQMEIMEVVEDETANDLPNTFKHIWKKKGSLP